MPGGRRLLESQHRIHRTSDYLFRKIADSRWTDESVPAAAVAAAAHWRLRRVSVKGLMVFMIIWIILSRCPSRTPTYATLGRVTVESSADVTL